ncbi:MAG: hypothetical protein LC803_23975 [Acidobacteria bacterium]|nr:hypothetical protein [Acidobacteriota bacterium]
MSKSIAQLVGKLMEDSWRTNVGFSQEIELSNQLLFDPRTTEDQAADVVNNWLQKYQPCLFGRIAAKLGIISYCVLTDADLTQSDQFIADKIQSARTQWTADGFEGKKSAFVVLAISSKLALAPPNKIVKEIAQRLGSLYLQRNVKADKIYLDEIFLEKPGRLRTAWMWPTGVNYFSAQGDKLWWQDHRIPGGIAFSVNSVGHMVKSGILANSMKELERLLGAPAEGWIPSKVDSLDKALELAMRTIGMASETISGKATELLPLERGGKSKLKECPVNLPSFLAAKNFCEYKGYYHTDYTLPSEYFLPDIARPKGLKIHTLDFTYLFDKRLDNPDFFLLGEGRRIRSGRSAAAESKINHARRQKVQKRRRRVERSIYINQYERLARAIGR